MAIGTLPQNDRNVFKRYGDPQLPDISQRGQKLGREMTHTLSAGQTSPSMMPGIKQQQFLAEQQKRLGTSGLRPQPTAQAGITTQQPSITQGQVGAKPTYGYDDQEMMLPDPKAFTQRSMQEEYGKGVHQPMTGQQGFAQGQDTLARIKRGTAAQQDLRSAAETGQAFGSLPGNGMMPGRRETMPRFKAKGARLDAAQNEWRKQQAQQQQFGQTLGQQRLATEQRGLTARGQQEQQRLATEQRGLASQRQAGQKFLEAGEKRTAAAQKQRTEAAKYSAEYKNVLNAARGHENYQAAISAARGMPEAERMAFMKDFNSKLPEGNPPLEHVLSQMEQQAGYAQL